jgi:thioredoxin-related protein
MAPLMACVAVARRAFPARRAAFFRRFLVWAILSWPPLALALAGAQDFASDAHQMRERKLPMLVLFSAAGCEWCERARQQVLDPMAADPASAARVLIRQIDIDRTTPVTDFSGKATTHRDFARARRIRLTPTLVVLDAEGRDLAEPIVGVRLADFYPTYIERAIDEGLARMRTNQ